VEIDKCSGSEVSELADPMRRTSDMSSHIPKIPGTAAIFEANDGEEDENTIKHG